MLNGGSLSRVAGENVGVYGINHVNTQVLKADLDGRMGFDELLAQARQRALEAQAHQDLPFEQLVELPGQ